MMMNDTVARIVEIMFQDVEKNEETDAIRDEVMNNCQERFTDMVASGISEDDAIAAVVESLKGMDDVLAPYKKTQHVREDADDTQDGEQHVVFAAHMVRRIDVALVSEDVHIEPSDDDNYHVLWNTDETHRIKAELNGDTLSVTRIPGENTRTKQDAKAEHHVHFEVDDMSDFVKSEAGKIEINMEGLGRSMKALGEKIKLLFAEGVKINVRSTDGKVTIQVPENAMPLVKLLTTSGDIDVQDVALADLNITSTSGDVNIDLGEDQHLARIEMRTTSGDMDVTAYADLASIASTSGDVEVEGRYNKLCIATISGDMDVRADVVNMNFSAISGDVELQFDSDEIRNVSGSTVSGDIEIDLPAGLGVMGIGTQTRSGDVMTCYATNGVGPAVTGGVSTMSGDITIR